MYNVGMPIDEKSIFYQRKTGNYDKGDRKIRKHLEELIPLLRGLNKSSTPEEAVQYFQNVTYKN